MSEARPVLEQPGRASSSEAGTVRFSRHRYELPLLSMFLCLAMIELLAVHLLVSLWSATAAWLLTALSFVAVVQIALLIRGMVRHPTEIDGRNVHVRHGMAGHVTVPLASIARVEDVAFAPEEKGAGVFRASLLASPNLALHLDRPVMVRKRERTLVTLRLDDPAAFIAAVGRAKALANGK